MGKSSQQGQLVRARGHSIADAYRQPNAMEKARRTWVGAGPSWPPVSLCSNPPQLSPPRPALGRGQGLATHCFERSDR